MVCFAAVHLAVKASSRQVGGVHPGFTCEPIVKGIKHHTNQTIGPEPIVNISCPQLTKLDEKAEIKCKVLSKTFANIEWFYNGQPINGLQKSHVTAESLSCNQILKITFAKSSDSGNYTCQVTNANGSVKKTCALEVKADKLKDVHIEHIKIAGGRKTAFLQGSVNLTCSMLNFDAAKWMKNGTSVKSGRHTMTHEDIFAGRGVILNLQIINVTKSDEGWYSCTGYKNGKIATKKLYLKTELCPQGFCCPFSGNEALPCPQNAPVKNTVTRSQLGDCPSLHQGDKPRVQSVTSKGLRTHNPELMILLMCTFMVIYQV